MSFGFCSTCGHMEMAHVHFTGRCLHGNGLNPVDEPDAKPCKCQGLNRPLITKEAVHIVPTDKDEVESFDSYDELRESREREASKSRHPAYQDKF